MLEINLADGKYKVLLSDDCKTFEALRYGEKWRDLQGDNLVLYLCWEIEDLRKALENKNSNA